MVQERDDFVLGFKADLSGLRQYLAALQALPGDLKANAAKVGSVKFGDTQLTSKQGRDLAKSLVNAFNAELAGGAKFERSVSRALGRSVTGFGLPPAAIAKMRQDLAEVQRLANATRQAASQASEPIRRTIPPVPPRAAPAPAPTPAAGGAGGPRRPIGPVPAPAPQPEPRPGGDRDAQIKALLAKLKEVTAEELTRARLAQKILEIERGITQALDAQAAARRLANSQRNPAMQRLRDDQERLDAAHAAASSRARSNNARRVRDDSERVDAAHAAASRMDRTATPQGTRDLRDSANRRAGQAQADTEAARRQGGAIGAARAASISPNGASPAEQFFRTARGVTAFTATAFPLYAAMNLVTQGLREATVGTLEYEAALSQLGVSLNEDKGELRSFASEIGSTANKFGLSQAEGVAAAARGVGAFGIGPDSGLSGDDQQDFLKRALKTAGQINYQSGTKDAIGTQQNIAGTLRSFGMANDQLEQAADSTTYISKRFGILASDLLNTTAQIGTQAQAAGFGLNQTQAIIANQAVNTGRSPDAIAGVFSQILAQADSTKVLSKLRGVGVDTDNTTLAQQIQQLATMVAAGQINQAKLNDVSSAFGRGASGQGFQILVRDFAKTQAAATDAGNKPGISEEIFNKLFNNISATFRTFVGNLRGIITELAQSGLLDFLGALLIVAEKATAAIYALLQVFNQIPRPLRTAAFLFLEIGLALKVIARFGGVAALLRGVGGALAATFNVLKTAQSTNAAATGAAVGANAAAAGAAAGARPISGQRGSPGRLLAQTLMTPVSQLGRQDLRNVRSGARVGASAALAGIGGLAGASALVGILVAAGTFKAVQARAETTRAVERADASGNTATTADQLRAAAAAQREAAEKARAEQRGGFNLRTIGTLGIAPLIANTAGSQEQQTADAKRKAQELEAGAKRLDEEKKATTGTAAGFSGFQSAEDVEKAFLNLDDAGYSASQQLALVTSAMQSLTDKATSTAAAIIPEGGRNDFTNAFGGVATKSVQEAINLASLRKQAASRGTFGFLNPLPDGSSNAAKGDLSTLQGIDTDALRTKAIGNVEQYLNSIGKTGEGDQALTTEELKALEDAQYEFIKKQLAPQLKALPEELQRTLLSSVKVFTKKDIEGAYGTAANGAVTSPDTIKNALGATQTAAGKVFEDQSQYNKLGATTGKRDTLQAAIKAAQAQQMTLTGDEFTEAGRYISAAQDELRLLNKDVASQLGDFAAGKAKLAQVTEKGDDSAAALANQIAAVKAQRAKATDPQEQQDLDVQAAELENQRRHEALDTLTAQAKAARGASDSSGAAKDAVAAAERALADAKANGGEKEIAEADAALDEAQAAQRQVALDTITAQAQDKRGASDAAGAAKDAVAAAERALADAKANGGEKEIADAGVALDEAQAAQRQVALDTITAQAKANRDTRDLSGSASDAVDAARRGLADAKANGGPQEIAQAQTAVNEAIAAQRDTVRDISKGKNLAAVPVGDLVAAADAALDNAKLDLAGAKKGQRAYYDALVAVAAARKEVVAALNQRRATRDLLSIDLTDPVAQAQAEVRDAKRQLASATGADDKDTARLNLRNKQNSAEAAAFSQRLSDAQTADELGRISHEAYLSYLRNEHNRLSAVKDRTRQQQDQLDQVDKLLKGAADQLNGQFNLGSIRLPTVYEARRAIAAGSAGVGGIAKYQTSQNQVSVDNSVKTLTLNGVPLQEVYKFVQSILSTNTTKTVSTGGR